MIDPNNPKISRHLRLPFWNADGVFEERQDLKYFLKEQRIDILLLNESHLKAHHNFKISNYTIVRNDRSGRIGGTAIVFKNHLPVQQIALPPFQTLEATGIRL